jgi:hypothetical protein
VTKREYLPEIIAICTELVLGIVLALYLDNLHLDESTTDPAVKAFIPLVKPFLLFMSLLFPILIYIFYKLFELHGRVSEHGGLLDKLITLNDKKVKAVSEEPKILQLLQELKTNATEFSAMWCLDYDTSLDTYFQKEAESFKGKRRRLFNLTTLNQRRGNISALKKHLSENQNDIINGNYEVYSTDFSRFEIILYTRVKNGRDIAVQLFNSPGSNRTGLAIYSSEDSFFKAMREMFEQNMIEENRLQVEGAGDRFEEQMEQWIDEKLHSDKRETKGTSIAQ